MPQVNEISWIKNSLMMSIFLMIIFVLINSFNFITVSFLMYSMNIKKFFNFV